MRAVCEQVIAAVDPTAEVHIAGGYGRGRPACYDLVRARVMDIAACLRVLTCVRYPMCVCRTT